MAQAAPGTAPRRGTPAFLSAIEAALAVERLCVDALWSAAASATNAAGSAVRALGEDPSKGAAALAACEEVAASGGRTAAVLSVAALVDARRALLGLVERRRAIVIHAVTSFPGDDKGVAAFADLHALGDVGVGVLVARDAQDAADLVVIAHRAAEDAETPIVILHDGFPATFARDRVVLPDAPLVRAALEPAKRSNAADEGLAPHRRAAARVPFAISSAMRAFERYSGRRLADVEAAHIDSADVVLVAAGAIAESARALVEEQRRDTDDAHPLGVVQLLVLRPFPGPDVVRAIGRARAVAILERADTPLSQSNPLATEVKAAFADALTWAPGYPGIGRIPTIFSACIDPSTKEATPGEIQAVIDAAIHGEHGPRTFRVEQPQPDTRVHHDDARCIRFRGDPALLVHLLADLYGGHVRATPRHAGEGEELWDVTLGPAAVRAHHGASELDAVVLQGGSTRAEATELEAASLLRESGVALVVGDIPSSVRSELSARRATIRNVSVDETLPARRTAIVAGALLKALPPRGGLDRAQLLADAERSLRTGDGSMDDGEVRAIVACLARGYDA